mmetsp:Transcript_8789/g.15458  ORF Transcript_8789/g.15458 Transcript_8789/m.15458 type:complete len:116 (+) Transcript_8789:133-480(+)|eukprot:CAMPEP_0184522806 /NCGR_PEP_ID=MMETSP0198_2-20121128/8495_1 /TAXON_ID=1112570 /ORGANISM="Thraustochytrium sp., Strain LLF1b" /LENGTH=115 /DNA_ID=CAMNT_0026913691 /DNA_START=128 /DNA_END=475 /DNA_ORIENTATION=+
MGDMDRLKKAEAEATKLVAAARQDRSATLRKAKAEAEAEIKDYRDAQMAKLVEFEKSKAAEAAQDTELERKEKEDTNQLVADFEANKSKVVQRLIQVTTTVDLSVPIARKGVKTK